MWIKSLESKAEQISKDNIEDICYKLTCYYVASTERYDRSLTDKRRVKLC